MRLPTVSVYRSQMEQLSKHHDHINTLQNQISSGKRLQRTSDDPVSGMRIKSIQNFIARIQSYSNNLNLAQSRVAVMDSNLGQAVDRVSRAVELVLQAKNDTLTDADRQNISTELKSILQEVLNIANTQSTSGEYIFSGLNSNRAAFEKVAGDYLYQGSVEGSQIDIGDGVRVLHHDSGQRVFGQMKSGNGYYSVSADKDNNVGSGVLSGVELINLNAAPESYTITMVTNASGQLAYEVTGSSSGQLIPAPPLVSPDDAPAFQAEESIVFNGLKVSIVARRLQGINFLLIRVVPRMCLRYLKH